MTQSILRFKKNSILGSQHGVRFGKSGSLILRIRISRDDGAQGSGWFSYSIRVSRDVRVWPGEGHDSFRVVTREEWLELQSALVGNNVYGNKLISKWQWCRKATPEVPCKTQGFSHWFGTKKRARVCCCFYWCSENPENIHKPLWKEYVCTTRKFITTSRVEFAVISAQLCSIMTATITQRHFLIKLNGPIFF